MIGQWLESGWILQGQEQLPYVLLMLGGALAASFAGRWLLGILQRGAQHTSYLMDDAVLLAASRPMQILIWFVALTLVGEVLLEEVTGVSWLEKIQRSGVFLILGWFLFSLIRHYSDQARQRVRAEGKELDEDLYLAVARTLQAVIIVLVGMGLLQTFGVSIVGILTFSGVGGLVVGFAAKEMLENFFGGLMLHMDRPFKTGDWIRSPDRSIEGTVERIGWRQTLIRTHSRNALYIPNGMFLTIVIENPSRMSHRMIKEVIGLRYDDLGKMKAIVAEVQAFLDGAADIDQEKPVLARFDAFSESSVDFFIQCYTPTVYRAEYTQIKQDILLEVAEIVERHGAEMAFPTRTLHMQPQSGGEPGTD